MYSTVSLSNLLQEQMLIYACWSIGICFLVKTKFIGELDKVIVWLTRIVGIAYFLQFPVTVLIDWLSSNELRYAIINRYTGPYWFTAVLPMLIYLMATQGLWWGYFRKAKYWRLLFCLIILLLGLTDQIMVWMLSFQRDYIPSSWAMRYQAPFLHLESIIFFCVTIGIMYFIIREKQIDTNII
ncbi:hypothetical protein ACS5PU_13135 [Pedobacter sp. GSP4]|uniref:hypothetical protein n=1 Tax=Pedobacter sp. GSP4 TaxID=3453716 RepID=UPI003EF04942